MESDSEWKELLETAVRVVDDQVDIGFCNTVAANLQIGVKYQVSIICVEYCVYRN